MLEAFVQGFNKRDFCQCVMEEKGLSKTDALSYIRRKVPKESYYQKKVKDGIKERYPGAFIVKVSQGNYSEGGIPDLVCIIDGHFFGFEIKRPIFGKTSKLQERTMKKIRDAGGTAIVVRWAEEAYEAIDHWRCTHEDG